MAILEVQSLTGGYTRKPVLQDVTFSINKGELVGLIGLNGAGKSTTIKHIIGLMQPQSGEIRLNGKTFEEDMDAYRSSFTYIPETPVLYEELTLREHLELTAMAYNLDSASFEKRSAELLKEFRMEKRLRWFPSHFSKGMRQKVMIICAFITNAKIFIIDEPFYGLDPLAIQDLLTLIKEVKTEGAAVLMSTHVLSTAQEVCDRFVMIDKGKITAQGDLAELKNQYQDQTASLSDIYLGLTQGERDE